jgi:hypothetical protein
MGEAARAVAAAQGSSVGAPAPHAVAAGRSLPPAAGERLEWTDVPDRVRAAAEGYLGSPVLAAVNQRGGFSPGPAARLRCADGTRAFVKATSRGLNAGSVDLHRAEAVVSAALPPGLPVPRLRHTYDDGEWVALVFDEIPGAIPATPWRAPDLHRVLAALTAMSTALTPCPWPAAPPLAERIREETTAYRRLAEDPPATLTDWERANLDRLAATGESAGLLTAGDTLVHLDVRADNVLLGSGGGPVWFVDWPWAARGAIWVDSATLVMEANLHGHDPEALVAAHPLLSAADPAAVTALLVGLAGMWAERWWTPPPPGLPTVRAFQRAFHRATLAWIRRRWGD